MSANSQNRDTLPCPSWVFASSSNTHVAKDRSWFGANYRPISSTISADQGASFTSAVIGIGIVNIPVKAKPDPQHHGNCILTLRNVLHVPSYMCNVIGMPASEHYNLSLGYSPGSKGSITLSDGSSVGFFAPDSPLYEVKLSDPPVGPRVGPSPFVPGEFYWINATWSAEEREKWVV